MRPIVGVSQAFIGLKQWAYSDSTDDYAERVYVWNSTAFEIDDRAVFVVDANGNRYIENFAIIPFYNNNKENFDFDSDDWVATIGNPDLKENVDPSGIGRTVEMNINQDIDTSNQPIFDYASYQNARSNIILPNPALLASLRLRDMPELTRDLYDSGVTKFMSDGKAVVFGNQDGEHVQLDEKINSYHEAAADNGVVFVGSDVADQAATLEKKATFYGFGGADILRGGFENDTLYGGDDVLYNGDASGNDDGAVDRLEGGAGDDTYYVGGGDIIRDSGGDGEVIFNGLTLQGGKAEKEEEGCDGGDDKGPDNKSDDGKVYEGENGETYTLKGTTLTVTYQGKTITIEDWAEGQLGIELKDGDPKDDGDDCDDSPDNYASPLVLDLDGDGIELISLEDSRAYFDIDKDGAREKTGWVSPDDGLLALDRNGNGVIDDAGELFGAGETYSGGGGRDNSALEGPGGLDIRYESGFARLAALDTNNDKVIDAKDAAYEQLRVWRDLNGDGVSDEGELFTLADVSIDKEHALAMAA